MNYYSETPKWLYKIKKGDKLRIDARYEVPDYDDKGQYSGEAMLVTEGDEIVTFEHFLYHPKSGDIKALILKFSDGKRGVFDVFDYFSPVKTKKTLIPATRTYPWRNCLLFPMSTGIFRM